MPATVPMAARPPPTRFVVCGGGIGGLTVALALAQDGHAVEVLERAANLAAVGAGVTLAPNAMRVFQHLGIAEAICRTGVEPDRQRIQHWRDGHTMVAVERGDRMRRAYGAPYIYSHRGDLHAVLIDALGRAGNVRVRLSAEVVGAVADAGGATVQLGDGDCVAADVVIGADGVRSRIRTLFEAEPAHFTGHVAWRTLIPVERLPDPMLASYPGVHIGPRRMVVRYPVRGGALLNVVMFAREAGWAEEGWTIPGRVGELDALFGGWCGEVRGLIGAIDEARLNKWAIFARVPLPDWVRDGRIALLGDAAHAMTPFLGQGASAAVEDALVLARCFRLERTPAAALARYVAARKDRCDFIQAESNANADRLQGDEAEMFGLSRQRNEETLGLFAYDAATVALT